MTEYLYRSLLDELMDKACAWHRLRFPRAGREHVAMKLGSEAGEVLDAVLGEVGVNSATGKGVVVEELADVLIAVLVLFGRWYPEIDPLTLVEKKLNILLTPGKHPASLPYKPSYVERRD